MTNTTTLNLTTDQAEAIAKMKSFIVNSENKFFRLTGYAGTGKSFTICQLIKWLRSAQYKVIAASPTNKAAKNLQKMASTAGLTIPVTTVAKLLGQQAVLNEETGKEEFISEGNEEITSFDVIIIDEFKINPNYVRFLVWRNKQADILNAYVRKHLWGENVPEYVTGDRLIAKVPVFRTTVYYTPEGKQKEGWQIILNSSEECEVLAESTLTYDKAYGWQHWRVPVITDDGARLDLQILTENGLREQKEFLTEMKAKRYWKRYYDALKSFDNVPYAYAITTHKAQGSSIDYIFPDTTDMQKCPELQKMLYTALTRAKIKAFIPNEF